MSAKDELSMRTTDTKKLLAMLLDSCGILDVEFVCKELDNFFPYREHFSSIEKILQEIRKGNSTINGILTAIYTEAAANAMLQLKFSDEERKLLISKSLLIHVNFLDSELTIIAGGEHHSCNDYTELLSFLKKVRREIKPKKQRERAKLDALGYILDKGGNAIATYNNEGKRVRVNYKGFEIRIFTIKGFRVTTNYLCNKLWPADDNMRNHYNHLITVSKDGKRCSFEYWGSIVNPEIKNELDAFCAVCCLASDAVFGLMDFEEFCSEFGYDTDSRKAERVWKACKRSAEKVERCFGDVWEFAELFADI